MKLLLPAILIIITSHISFAKNRKVSSDDPQLFNLVIFEQIIKLNSIPINKHESCSKLNFSNSASKDATPLDLGRFLSWNLSILSTYKNKSTPIECKKTSDQKQKVCSLTFQGNSGPKDGSPWQCGLQFNIDDKNIIDTDSISCDIGPC